MNVVKQKQWVSVITVVLAAATLVVYALTTEAAAPLVFLQVTACALIPTVLLLLERITARSLSMAMFAAVALHVVLASFCGSALGFYYHIPWWDLFLHGLFGVLAAAMLAELLSRHEAVLGRSVLLLVIFLSVMGLAALWEVFEYVSDLVVGGDAQRVAQALASGGSPVGDTMTDIIITAVGVAVYFGGAGIFRRMKKCSRR
ncbi:MAG: hypothetical protein IKB04_01555 [Clostridia bacterium]|nr:hypothetical protein [Clostridia bacterium]